MRNKYQAIKETERALARIVLVDDVIKHPNADALELAIVGGWQCCVKIGEFKKGDKAVYFEIDSLLPTNNPEFNFLAARKEGLMTFFGQEYARIRTIKLRKELSQGLLLPAVGKNADLAVDTNVTESLAVLKLDELPPGPDGMDGKLAEMAAEGNWWDKFVAWVAGPTRASNLTVWPNFIEKTAQKRVQNVANIYNEASVAGEEFEKTAKLDGSSMTGFVKPEKATDAIGTESLRKGVCSRNYEVSLVDIHIPLGKAVRRYAAELLMAGVSGFKRVVSGLKWLFGSIAKGEETLVPGLGKLVKQNYFYWPKLVREILAESDMYAKYALDNNLVGIIEAYYRSTGLALAVQGELCGPGIQDNFEGLAERKFFVYQMQNTVTGKFLLPDETRAHAKAMGFEYVPVLDPAAKLVGNTKDCLKDAEGPRALAKGGKREGVVYKSRTRDFSFKAVSTSYLLDKEKAVEKALAVETTAEPVAV